MPNVHDYIEWRGDIPLDAVGFSDADNLVLSALCFLNFDGIISPSHTDKPIPLCRAAEEFFANGERANEDYGCIFPTKDFIRLLRSASSCRRYADIGLSAYVNRVDYDGTEQFGALTFSLPDKSIYVAFKGTDDNIVAWKEDFLLSYEFPIRAQRSALSYLTEAAEASCGGIYIGGHSKGGNLAFFSAAFSAQGIKDRILRVWSNDGPGFYRRVVSGEQYTGIKDKFVTILPEGSVIGRLFDNEPSREIIVRSKARGLLQHDPFTWQMMGGGFVEADGFTDDSTVIRRAFRKYLSEIDGRGREDFVSAFFALLEATNAKTLTELMADGFIILPMTLKRLGGLTPSQREMLLSFVSFLARLPVK